MSEQKTFTVIAVDVGEPLAYYSASSIQGIIKETFISIYGKKGYRVQAPDNGAGVGSGKPSTKKNL